MGGPEKGRSVEYADMDDLFGSGVLGDGFSALADSMLGQFSREEKADGSLHLAATDGRFFVVLRQARCFVGDALEDVVDETVHDRHSATRDASVRMNLFEHLVDVDSVALLPPPIPLLAPTWSRGLGGFLGTFLSDLTGWSHCGNFVWFKSRMQYFEEIRSESVKTARGFICQRRVPGGLRMQSSYPVTGTRSALIGQNSKPNALSAVVRTTNTRWQQTANSVHLYAYFIENMGGKVPRQC